MMSKKHNNQGRISGFDDKSIDALSPINMSVLSPNNMFEKGQNLHTNQDLDSVLDKMS